MAEDQDIQEPQVAEAPQPIGGGQPQPPAKLTLSDDSRRKLDSIVSKMVANKEKDEDIQAVVNDFKQKYAVKPTAPQAVAPPPVPDHEIQHSPVQDIRHVQDMANQPLQTRVVDPQGGLTEPTPESIAKNKGYQDQYSKMASDMGLSWGAKPDTVKQVLNDFPDEQQETKLKDFATLAQANPVNYARLKNSNDIRIKMAQDGPSGLHDANVFNHLLDATDYNQLTQENIPYQQQLMRAHGMGQADIDKLKEAQRPLINSTDPGLNIKYWQTNDHEYDLTPDEYAGLETERLFNPNKAAMDEAALKHARGIGEDGKANPIDVSKESYEYQRGLENIKYNLQMTGRDNLARYVNEQKPEVDKQVAALKDDYQTQINAAPNPQVQQQLIQDFQNNPIVQKANQLEDAQEGMKYSVTEDARRYPLNFSDQATRAVSEAMDHTAGFGSDVLSLGGSVLQGAGQTADNTARFIKNMAINILGSDESKAINNTKDIGHQALTELAAFQPSSYTGTENPILVPRETQQAVQSILNGPGTDAEKQQKAISYIRDNFDQLQANPKSGQQNLTGKAALFQAANVMGQILGVANQSFLLGGVIGDAATVQKMATAFTPMFMSTQNQMYEQAVQRGDEHPLLKSNIDATILSLASLINPDIKVVKGMVGADTGVGKMIAGIDESTWNKVLSDNKPMVDRMIGAAKATGRQLGLANLQYGVIAPTAQYLAHKSILNEDPNLGDMIKDGVIQTSISMALPSLLHGVWGGKSASEVNPQQKYAIVEAGLHPDQNIDLIDSKIKAGTLPEIQGHEMKQLIKHAGEILQNSEMVKTDGTPMNEKEVADNVYSMLRKQILENKRKTAAEPIKPIIDDQIHQVNKEITDLHTSDADKQKGDLNQLLHDSVDKIDEEHPLIAGMIKEDIKNNEPERAFQRITEEYNRENDKENGDTKSINKIYGKKLVDKAIELSKQSKTEKNGENSQGQQANERGQVVPQNPSEDAALTTRESPASSFLESRHADTMDDEKGLVSGPNDAPISKEGRKDAKDLANSVEGKGVTKIITSDLERAKQTGQVVADKTGATVEHRPELNTWDIGDFDKSSDEEFKKAQRYFVENPDAKQYPWTFKTAKGSEYTISENGTTTRDKAKRASDPESGKQEKSKKTYYLTPEDLDKLSEIQTSGKDKKIISETKNGKIGVKYTNGENAGKFERRTLVSPKENPEVGLHPLEVWKDGEEHHFGNKITEVQPSKNINESFNEYKDRVIKARGELEKEPSSTLVVNHSNNMMLWDAYEKNGHEWNEQAQKDYLESKTPEPATLTDKSKENAFSNGGGQVESGPIDEQGKTEGTEPDSKESEQDVDALPFGRSGVGIAERVKRAREYDTGVKTPESGEGITTQQGLDRGRELLSQGADPDKIIEEFNKDNKISAETIGVVRARLEQLSKATNDAIDQHGEDSPEAKAASDAESEFAAKIQPMQTEWHKIGMTQQGEADLDTGTVTSIKRAFRDVSGKPLTEKQSEKAKELHGKIKEQDGIIKKLIAKIDDLINNQREGTEKGVKEQAKNVAKKIRDNAKLNRPGMFSAATPASIVWDAAVEVVAKAIEAGGAVAEAIGKGIEHIKASDWYQGLEKSQQAKAIKQFSDWHKDTTTGKIDVKTHFVDKKDNNFTPNESKAIWEHAKEVISGGKTDMHDVFSQVAMDTGLSTEQVRRAIAQPKGAKVITNEMYAAMYKRNQVLQAAKVWVKSADQSAAKKFWNKAIKVPSAIVTFGHGSVAPITHVGTDLYRPSNWKSYFGFMLDSYTYSFGGMTDAGKARYENAMADLVRDPLYPIAKRSGLKIDPTDLSGDDYSKYQGVFGRLVKMGERGFNAMKPYRLEQWKKIYNGLSDQAKANPDVVKAISHMVNLSSGTTDAKIPPGTDALFFAPKLVTSQYQRIFTEPVKAVHTFATWKTATDAEKLQAKMVARHAGEMIATYGALLAANQAILSMSGSKQKINFTNPLNSDWMKFKTFGKTVDASGGMNSALRFVGSLVQEGARANGIMQSKEKGKPGDVEGRKILQQMTNKLSPAAGDLVELFSGTDAMGNSLPWSSVNPSGSREKLTMLDYLETKFPIPLAEGIKTIHDAAKEKGMPDPTLSDYLQGILVGGLTGTTGAKISPDNQKENNGGSGGGAGAGGRFAGRSIRGN